MLRRDGTIHLLATVTLGLSFVLVAVGGLVTNTGSALAVPDWPTTFGYNMFTYPVSEWKGGVLYEHSHRLLGSAVGLCTILLTIAAWRWATRRVIRWLSVAVLAAVIVQGVLGGLRVVLLEHSLAIVHGCFAQAFLGLLAVLWALTARSWRDKPVSPGIALNWIPAVLFALFPVALYSQIVLGAFLTHRGVYLWYHISGAGVVSLLAVFLVGWILKVRFEDPGLRRPALAAAGLLTLQLSLGLLAYLWHFEGMHQHVPFEAGLALLAGHRITGSLLWVLSVVLCVRYFGSTVRVPLVEPRIGLRSPVGT